LVTLHRDFNVDNKEKFEKILQQLKKISEHIKIVFPTHPRTRKRIEDFKLWKYLENAVIIEPVDYLNLMGLVKNCWKVITDSGGLQKEAYFAGKRAVIVMPDTGWRELVEAEWNSLSDENNLFDITMKDNSVEYPEKVYGDGNSSEKIVEIIKTGFLKNS
ncbi:MAG TPA: UDP-N-acetylglucosamine 2-epimerase, partial [Pseudothermotoga sp.]|nr:UDP-N-acetylglucosamine 2-epimerase [Pseudothermotoga sp.]